MVEMMMKLILKLYKRANINNNNAHIISNCTQKTHLPQAKKEQSTNNKKQKHMLTRTF